MLVIGLRRRIGWMRFSDDDIEDWAYKSWYSKHRLYPNNGFHIDEDIVNQTNEFLNCIKRNRCQ